MLRFLSILDDGSRSHRLSVFGVLDAQFIDPVDQLLAPGPGQVARLDVGLHHGARQQSAQGLLLHLQKFNEELVHLFGQGQAGGFQMSRNLLKIFVVRLKSFNV